ncbi:MAG TPA: hypothetical protein VFL13_15950, partial [Candidatus Baltobacteraceae bacterium]|nr:hypothetical protein [Candidatus Baltobacteraceae bacterium]
MRTFVRSIVYLTALSLAVVSCSSGGGSGTAAIPSTTNAGGSNAYTVEGFPAMFTEYATPAGIVPADITMGPGGNPWFANFHLFDSSNVGGGELLPDGTFQMFSEPSGFFAGSNAIGYVGSSIWTVATGSPEDESFLMQTNASGATTVSADLGTCCGSPFTKIIRGPDGNIWMTGCTESCPEFSAFVEAFDTSGHSKAFVRLGDPATGVTYVANAIAAGPDGNLYVTANYTGVPGGSGAIQSSVFKISPAGVILNQFALPDASAPFGIVTGPDHNLWVTESGTGKVAKMTTGGAFTEYPLAASNAGPLMITIGTDGALWFTESGANALGR